MIDNHRPIIYISGWKGAGRDSGTFRWLEKHFTNLDAYATGGCVDPGKMKAEISEIIARCEIPPLIVGNSYGGFLASLLGCEAVVVNPALYPSQTLPAIADLTAGEISDLDRWERERDNARTPDDRLKYYAVVSTDDELIPDHREHTISGYTPVQVPGGKHRLTDEQRERYILPLIIRVLSGEKPLTSDF